MWKRGKGKVAGGAGHVEGEQFKARSHSSDSVVDGRGCDGTSRGDALGK